VAIDGNDSPTIDALLRRQFEQFIERVLRRPMILGHDLNSRLFAAGRALRGDQQARRSIVDLQQIDRIVGTADHATIWARHALPDNRLWLLVALKEVDDIRMRRANGDAVVFHRRVLRDAEGPESLGVCMKFIQGDLNIHAFPRANDVANDGSTLPACTQMRPDMTPHADEMGIEKAISHPTSDHDDPRDDADARGPQENRRDKGPSTESEDKDPTNLQSRTHDGLNIQ
jgi:hypothetical protein